MGNVGNLGPYQEFAILAKKLGGVDKLIEAIESGAAKKAVKKAAPVLLAAGAVAGAGATKLADAGKRRWSNYKESQSAAAEAKEKLARIVEESVPEGDDEEPDTDPST